jgi:hypothetical protein
VPCAGIDWSAGAFTTCTAASAAGRTSTKAAAVSGASPMLRAIHVLAAAPSAAMQTAATARPETSRKERALVFM